MGDSLLLLTGEDLRPGRSESASSRDDSECREAWTTMAGGDRERRGDSLGKEWLAEVMRRSRCAAPPTSRSSRQVLWSSRREVVLRWSSEHSSLVSSSSAESGCEQAVGSSVVSESVRTTCCACAGQLSAMAGLPKGRRLSLGGAAAGWEGLTMGTVGMWQGRAGMEVTEGVPGSSSIRGLLEEHREGPGEHAEEYPEELRFPSDALKASTPRKGLRKHDEEGRRCTAVGESVSLSRSLIMMVGALMTTSLGPFRRGLRSSLTMMVGVMPLRLSSSGPSMLMEGTRGGCLRMEGGDATVTLKVGMTMEGGMGAGGGGDSSAGEMVMMGACRMAPTSTLCERVLGVGSQRSCGHGAASSAAASTRIRGTAMPEEAQTEAQEEAWQGFSEENSVSLASGMMRGGGRVFALGEDAGEVSGEPPPDEGVRVATEGDRESEQGVEVLRKPFSPLAGAKKSRSGPELSELLRSMDIDKENSDSVSSLSLLSADSDEVLVLPRRLLYLQGVGRGEGTGVGMGVGNSVMGERQRYCSLPPGTSRVIMGPECCDAAPTGCTCRSASVRR